MFLSLILATLWRPRLSAIVGLVCLLLSISLSASSPDLRQN